MFSSMAMGLYYLSDPLMMVIELITVIHYSNQPFIKQLVHYKIFEPLLGDKFTLISIPPLSVLLSLLSI